MEKNKHFFYYTTRIIFFPLYLIGILIPKNDKVWIFGAGNGTKYNENSKALFEYVNKNKSKNNLRPIWLTKSKGIARKLIKENKEAYNFYSIEGIYYSIVAKVLVLSTSFLDVNYTAYLFHSKSKIIQLWHGTPLKSLKVNVFSLRNKILIWVFLQYIGRESDLMISATDKNKNIYEEISLFRLKNIKTTGQPRNDILFKTKKDKNGKKLFFYLPTWREYDKKFDFFIQYKFNLDKIDNFLAKNNASLIIKLHACDEGQYKEINGLFFGAKNILLSQVEDIYEILPKVDVLITDYSSVYFDFLLLNRAIIFTPFDLEQYAKLHGFYYNYDSVTPGPKARDWNKVISCMQDILDGVDEFKEKRSIVNNDFNKYKDEYSSARVFQEIIEIVYQK